MIITYFVTVGGLVYGNSFGTGQQYHEWTSFISDGEFCFRACVGPKATSLCNHIYDVMGCYWVHLLLISFTPVANPRKLEHARQLQRRDIRELRGE